MRSSLTLILASNPYTFCTEANTTFLTKVNTSSTLFRVLGCMTPRSKSISGLIKTANITRVALKSSSMASIAKTCWDCCTFAVRELASIGSVRNMMSFTTWMTSSSFLKYIGRRVPDLTYTCIFPYCQLHHLSLSHQCFDISLEVVFVS